MFVINHHLLLHVLAKLQKYSFYTIKSNKQHRIAHTNGILRN